MSNFGPKDLETISNGVLDGDVNMDQLPSYVQTSLADYWQGAGVDFSNREQSEAQIAALMEQRKQAEGGGFFDSPIFKPIEWVGSKLYSLYSATVSPALSTGFMALHSIVYGRPDYIGEDGEWDAAKDYWELSHSVSPGQSVWMLGLDNKELKNRGLSVDQMAADKKLALEGEYRDTPTVNDPFGTKTRAEEYFGGGVQKYVTGATDFAVSWYADPLVVAGKAAGGVKAAAITKPVAKEFELAAKAGEKVGLAPNQTAELFSRTPTFQKMVDKTMDIKAKNPNNAALVLRRDFPTVSKSANGDSLARLLDQAKDADEVSDILRVSMGDDLTRFSLEVKNVKLGYQMDVLTKRNVAHGEYFDAMTDAQKASPRGQKVKQALDKETDFVNRLNQQTRTIDDTIKSFASIDNMNFNSVTTTAGMKVRGSKAWQQGDTLRPMSAGKAGGKVRAGANLVYNASIGIPIKVARSYNDIKPTMYIDIHHENSYKDVEATLRETSVLSRGEREMLVSNYLRANPAERQLELVKIEEYAVSKMVERHNVKAGPDDQVSLDVARDLYKDFAQRRRNGQIAAAGSQRVYGTAEMADPANPGLTLRVASVEADGSRLVSTPIFDTQLANSHVMMDFGAFERMLKEQGSTFQKLKNAAGDKVDWLGQAADTLGQYWKFAQLFRLGYAPRALADDFLGQVARFGGTAMVGRAINGGKVAAEDFFRARWMKGDTEMARIWAGKEAQNIEELSRQEEFARRNIVEAAAVGSAGGRPIEHWQGQLDAISEDLAQARIDHAEMTRFTAEGQQMRDVKIGREVFSPAFGGKEGELFKDLAAGQRNFQNLMGSQSDAALRRMRRLNWENIAVDSHGVEKHMEAWIRHVNDQIGQSSVGKQALLGKSEHEMVQWMRTTPEGQAYRRDIGLKNMSDHELATRVKAQVDYVLNPSVPSMDATRRAILDGKLTREMLEDVPIGARPMVNGEQWRYAEGTSPVAEFLDKSISGWYNIANQIPASKLLRNPLFGQQYKANLQAKIEVLKSQGIHSLNDATRRNLENSARRAALQDVKKYTFTMDHETKMAYMMRNFGAFFGAQQESWNRWSRIIAEKPQTLAHVGQVYGAPARAGIVVDQDGNSVDAAGYVTDPVTGERRLTEYTERKMLIQVPEYLGGKAVNKFLGMDEDASFVVPMSSVELVLNSGDGALPVGVGPYVQIAANNIPGTEFDAQGNPKVADWAQKLGVLPFGPQESVWNFVNPNTGRKLNESQDEFGATKQRNMFYMMQVENYKWENGLRDTQPTWKELEDRASRWSIFRSVSAFALPVSVNGQDPYQFFRDEFQRYQKLDVDTADEKFYEKYGDSFYTFTQSMAKNNTGLRPTQEAVRMSKHYQDLIEQVGPEFAGVVVGHEGDGEFSKGAYFYQKTHSTDVASNKPDRTQMSAREAWSAANVSRGWKQYNSFREQKYAELFDRGLTAFSDEGAEDLQEDMELIETVLTQDKFLDGTENPYYNKDWQQDFTTLDKGKYDRNAASLLKVVEDPEVWSKAVSPDGTVGIRSEIYSLRTYLGYRREMQKALAIRKMDGGSDDPQAQSNADLKDSWDRMVISLIEKDTKFSYLHSRFFSTDLGFSRRLKEEEGELQETEANATGTLGTTPDMFDIMEMGAR